MRPKPLILPPSPVDDARTHQTPRAAQPHRRRSVRKLVGGLACIAAALLIVLQLRLAGRRVVHHLHEQLADTRSAPRGCSMQARGCSTYLCGHQDKSGALTRQSRASTCMLDVARCVAPDCFDRHTKRASLMSRAGRASGRAQATPPSLAVLVPYRDRPEQLAVFVPHMRQHLAAQGGSISHNSRPLLSTSSGKVNQCRSVQNNTCGSSLALTSARRVHAALLCGRHRQHAAASSTFCPNVSGLKPHVCVAGIAHVVIVAEQLGTGPFNRGALLNFAFLAAQPGVATMAIVDVDMLPLPGVNFSNVGYDNRPPRPSAPHGYLA